MKDSTMQELMSILDSTPNLTFRHVEVIFDTYARHEIVKMEDLHKGHDGFQSFVQRHIRKFPMDDRTDAVTLAYSRWRALKNLSDNEHLLRSRQETFASQVDSLVNGDTSVKILEVGSGNIPYSSILLGNKGYNITSMDEIYLPPDVLARFNVRSNRSMFNGTSKVKGFDIVVGRKPCSAIKSIVANCAESKVPYYLRLCGCDLESGNLAEWKEILPRIDKSVRFRSAYAYNLGNSKFELDSLHKSIDMDEEGYFCF